MGLIAAFSRTNDWIRRGRGRTHESRRTDKHRSALVSRLNAVLIFATGFVLLNTFVVQTFVVISGSMEGTLLLGDFLFVNRAGIGARIPFTHVRFPGYSSPRRGDVVVFRPPSADLMGMELVKRLIGVPGDTIQMRDRVVYIGGRRLREPYTRQTAEADVLDSAMAWQKQYLVPTTDPRTYTPTRDNWGPLIIPKNRYLVMGDNREESFDSRYWGLIDRSQIDGQADFIFFSYHKEPSRSNQSLHGIRFDRVGHRIR